MSYIYGVYKCPLCVCVLPSPPPSFLSFGASVPTQLVPTPSTPPRPHKPPHRRLSSTPKHPSTCVSPNADISLEEALFHRRQDHERTEESVTNRSKEPERGANRSQVAVQSGRRGVSKGKKRGLSVSFVAEDECKTKANQPRGLTSNTGVNFAAKRSLGRSLIDSLNSSRHGALDRSMAELRKSGTFPRKYAGGDPALGYDWIAGLLDAGSYLAEHDDAYFEEMREFRRVNHDECVRVHGPL